MGSDKRAATRTKTLKVSFIFLLYRTIIFFLSRIGDITIIIGKGILFVLKLSFSISQKALPRFVYLWNTYLDVIDELVKFISVTIRFFISLIHLAKIKFKTWQHLIRPPELPSIKPPAISLPAPHLPRLHFIFPRFKFSIPHPPPFLMGFVSGALVLFTFVFIPYNLYLFVKYLPNPQLLSKRELAVTTQIFDRNGSLLYEIHGDEDRKPVTLSDVPEIVKQATIAIEDRSFYTHPGFSIRAILRAFWETVFNGHLQGGSTITQQLVKNALLTSDIKVTRKIREVVLAFWTERIYSKNEILEMYFNQVPYGGTSWGIEAAAETYFGKQVVDLNLAEAAFLAGLPAAPTLYSPYGARPEFSRNRQEEVLRRMWEDGYITRAEWNNARNTSLPLQPQVTNIRAPHFVMYVRELLTREFGQRLVDHGGLRVTTSLNLPLQEKVQEIVTTNVNELTRLKVGNGAAIVTTPKTGEVLAMVGSKDYFDSTHDGNVNVTLAPRQPGSSIKVVTYAAALEHGQTAATIIEDTPVSYTIPGSPVYTPVNYDGRFHGSVTMRTALASSYNVPAVKTLNQIGVATMVEMGKRMGISTWDDDSRFGLSLTLGGGEVTLADMATVYGVLANSGNRVDLNPILKITDYTGRVLYEKPAVSPANVLSSEIAFILSDILADNRARSAAFGSNSTLVIPGKTVSVKTGTTNEKRDNWTIGYTGDYVVGVWVGNNDNTPMDPFLTSGITGASPIWHQVMAYLLRDKPDQPLIPPTNIVSLPCMGRSEYFVKGTEPKNGCAPLPSPSTQLSQTIIQSAQSPPLPHPSPSPRRGRRQRE